MADSQHGRLIVLCGPAGVGKGTVLGRVREQHPEILAVGVRHDTPASSGRSGRRELFLHDRT